MSENIVVLCPHEVISIESSEFFFLNDAELVGGFAPLAEDAVEDMVVFLAGIEAAWATGEFTRLGVTLESVATLASRIGLKDVATVAYQALDLVEAKDEVALAAVIARLVRVGESSLATLLEISYRQI